MQGLHGAGEMPTQQGLIQPLLIPQLGAKRGMLGAEASAGLGVSGCRAQFGVVGEPGVTAAPPVCAQALLPPLLLAPGTGWIDSGLLSLTEHQLLRSR